MRTGLLSPILILFFGVLLPTSSWGDSRPCNYTGIENPSVAQDFLSLNTFCKRIRWVPVARVWSDLDDEYIKEGLARALQEAVDAALRSPDNQNTAVGGALERLKKEFKKAAFDELVKTPKVFKLIGKRIQIDIYFIPELDDWNSFDNELASNFLIRMGKRSSQQSAGPVIITNSNALQRKMASARNPLDWAKLEKTFRRIHQLSQETGQGQSRFTFLGGVATASLKIVNLEYRPLERVIPTPHNLVHGFFQFRRWFSTHAVENNELRDGKNTTVTRLKFGDKNKRAYVTADVKYDFNLKNVMPTLNSMEVHFGTLLDSYGREIRKQDEFLMPTEIPFVGLLIPRALSERVHTSFPLILEGQRKNGLEDKYKKKIHAMTWSFDTGGFIPKATEPSLRGFLLFPKLLMEHGSGIAEDLGFGRFYDLDAKPKGLVPKNAKTQESKDGE